MNDVPNENIYSNAVSTILFFSLAIFIDYMQNRLKSSGNQYQGDVQMNDVFDSASVNKEKNEAWKED